MSAALLRRLEKHGGIHVLGLPWQGDGWRQMPLAALASNILCKQHNSDLSALDSVAEKFVDHLERVESEFQDEHHSSWLWILNGHDLERWLLKTLCGLLLSKSGRMTTGQRLGTEIPEGWIDILYGKRSFPTTWGLYVVGRVGHTSRMEPRKYNFAPVSLGDAVVGIRAELVGHSFTLILTDVPPRCEGAIDESSVYRPRYMSLEGGGRRKTIFFHWSDSEQDHYGVTLTWSPPKASP